MNEFVANKEQKKHEKRIAGPERLTYQHVLTLKAGERYLTTLLAENNEGDPEWIKEWVALAKKRVGISPVEWISEKLGISEERLLAQASKGLGVPMIDCEAILSPNCTHYMVDGLPMALIGKTPHGAVTLVHCVPHLEQTINREDTENIYEALKINFALTTATSLLKHIQRVYNSGKAKNRILSLTEEEAIRRWETQIRVLKNKELLEPAFDEGSTRKEILEAMQEEKPKRGAIGETEWYSLCTDIPVVDLATIASPRELIEIMAPGTQKKYNVVPVCEYGNLLTIGAKRTIPSSIKNEMIGELGKRARIGIILCQMSTINEIINTNVTSTISTTDIANQIRLESTPDEEEAEIIDVGQLAQNDEASITRVVQSILVGAINKRATDIHIAAHETGTWIRYRIDGQMVDAPYQLGAEFWKSVISRIKIISAIDIRYSPVPQDGKFASKISGQDYDIRVNTCQTIYGEKAVLRIQKKDAEIPTLESLGFLDHEKTLIGNLLGADHGMLIICGPTGSGKTRTLSATMNLIDRKRWNVITAENPVEIRIPLVEQTPIDGHQMTFGKFVPAALRQDPDYIMIGETRDKETTEEVIRAAITGHIVMTTLHTNSAAGAAARLVDMGGEPFLITDSLKVVIAQRLVRKLCQNCCKPPVHYPTKEELITSGIEPEWMRAGDNLLEPTGCKICNHTGYAGRTAVAEGYAMTPEIRRIIMKENADTDNIRAEMIKQGGKTMFQGAVEMAARGETSIQEALSIKHLD
jgi:type II secretory ATPase GspE/PulE/Tfp pilus assembly ATPase PilB-like protein